MCTYNQFQNFFYAKAFDIVSNGSFKKHLTKCKEANDQWAVDMYNDTQIIQNIIKDLQALVHEIPATPSKFFEVCKDVMSSAQPPIKMYAGTATCVLTNTICHHCLDFSKIHKKEGSVFVDAKFSQFFLLLWYCNKIEYIIRSFTRNWVDQQTEAQDFKTLCENIQNTFTPHITKIHNLFMLSHDHVVQSLHLLIAAQLHRPIIV